MKARFSYRIMQKKIKTVERLLKILDKKKNPRLIAALKRKLKALQQENDK